MGTFIVLLIFFIVIGGIGLLAAAAVAAIVLGISECVDDFNRFRKYGSRG